MPESAISLLEVVFSGMTLLIGIFTFMLNSKFNALKDLIERHEALLADLQKAKEKDLETRRSDINDIFKAIEKIGLEVKEINRSCNSMALEREKLCANHKEEMLRELRALEREFSSKYVTKDEFRKTCVQ